MKTLKVNNSTQNLCLFICFLICLNSFSNITANNQKLSTVQHFGFFCLKLKEKITPLRINFKGNVECLSFDNENCFTGDNCQFIVDINFNNPYTDYKSTLLECNVEKNLDWCDEAQSLFFNNKFILPSQSGLEISFRINSNKRVFECLANDEGCFTLNEAEEEGFIYNCGAIENYKILEIGSNEYKALYSNDGLEGENSLGNKLFKRYIDTSKPLLPEQTGIKAALNLENNAKCYSNQENKCFELNQIISETEKKILEELVKKNSLIELKNSNLNNVSSILIKNILKTLSLNGPVSELTEKNIKALNEKYIGDIKNLDENNKLIADKEKQIDILKKKLEKDEKYLLSSEINFSLLKISEAQMELIKIKKNSPDMEIKLENDKINYMKNLIFAIKKEQEVIAEIKKSISKDPNGLISMIKKLEEREASIKDQQKKIDSVISESNKIIEKIEKEKKKELIESEKAKDTEIKKIRKIYEELLQEEITLIRNIDKILDEAGIVFKNPKDISDSSLIDNLGIYKYGSSEEDKKIYAYSDETIGYFPTNSDGLQNNINSLLDEWRKDFNDDQIFYTPSKIPINPLITADGDLSKFTINNLKSNKWDSSPLEEPYSLSKNKSSLAGSYKFLTNQGTSILSGSTIILSNRNNKILKTYNELNIKPAFGSKMRLVFGGDLFVNNVLDLYGVWIIENADGTNLPFRNGSIIKFKHQQTRSNLFSQPQFKSVPSNKQEVVGFTGSRSAENASQNTLWRLHIKNQVVQGDLKTGDEFVLEHLTTKKILNISSYDSIRVNEKEVYCSEDNDISSLFSIIYSSMPKENKLKVIPVESPKPVEKVKKTTIVKTFFKPKNLLNIELINLVKLSGFSNNTSNSLKDYPYSLNEKSLNSVPVMIASSPLIQYLRKIKITTIGNPVNTKDKINIQNVITGEFLKIKNFRHKHGSFGLMAVTENDTTPDINNNSSHIFTFEKKGVNSLNQVEFDLKISLNENNSKVVEYRLKTLKGIKSNALGQQVFFDNTISSFDTRWIAENIHKIFPDEPSVGQLYLLKNKKNECYLSLSNIENFGNREVYCSEKPMLNSAFIISHNLSYSAPSKSYNDLANPDNLNKLSNNSKLINDLVINANSFGISDDGRKNFSNSEFYKHLFPSTFINENLSKLASLVDSTNLYTEYTSSNPVNLNNKLIIFNLEIGNLKSPKAYLTNNKHFGGVSYKSKDALIKLRYIDELKSHILVFFNNGKAITLTANKSDFNNSELILSGANSYSDPNSFVDIYSFKDNYLTKTESPKAHESLYFYFKNRNCFLALTSHHVNDQVKPICVYMSTFLNCLTNSTCNITNNLNNKLVLTKYFIFKTDLVLPDPSNDLLNEKVTLPNYFKRTYEEKFKAIPITKFESSKLSKKQKIQHGDIIMLRFITNDLEKKYKEDYLYSHSSILPWTMHQDVLAKQLETNKNNSSNAEKEEVKRRNQLFNWIIQGTNIVDGSEIELVHFVTGKCLTFEDTYYSDSNELVFTAKGQQGECGRNSKFKLRKKDNINSTKKLSDSDKIIFLDESSPFAIEVKSNLYLSYKSIKFTKGEISNNEIILTTSKSDNIYLNIIKVGNDANSEDNYYNFSLLDDHKSISSLKIDGSLNYAGFSMYSTPSTDTNFKNLFDTKLFSSVKSELNANFNKLKQQNVPELTTKIYNSIKTLTAASSERKNVYNELKKKTSEMSTANNLIYNTIKILTTDSKTNSEKYKAMKKLTLPTTTSEYNSLKKLTISSKNLFNDFSKVFSNNGKKLLESSKPHVNIKPLKSTEDYKEFVNVAKKGGNGKVGSEDIDIVPVKETGKFTSFTYDLSYNKNKPTEFTPIKTVEESKIKLDNEKFIKKNIKVEGTGKFKKLDFKGYEVSTGKFNNSRSPISYESNFKNEFKN